MPNATSTVDTTKTTTTTSTRTQAARTGARALSNQPSVLTVAAEYWAVMSGDERNSYAVLTSQLIDALEPALPRRKTAYSTFVSVMGACLSVSQTAPATAVPYAPAPPLPDIQISATYVNGALSVLLTPDVPFLSSVAVRAARPRLAADTLTTAAVFKKIGALGQLAGPVDISAMFQSRYRVPGTGYKIALELTGVMPGGFQTHSVYLFGAVTDDAAEAARTEPEAHLKVG